MKAIGYVRVSTDKQADRGVSLEAQVEKIKAMAVVHDVELLDVIVDAGESAKDLDRPGHPTLASCLGSRVSRTVHFIRDLETTRHMRTSRADPNRSREFCLPHNQRSGRNGLDKIRHAVHSFPASFADQ